jgi:hypothetical protein
MLVHRVGIPIVIIDGLLAVIFLRRFSTFWISITSKVPVLKPLLTV